MKKRIDDMTAQDKDAFMLEFRCSIEKQGLSWPGMKAKIQNDIDATFDDEKFQKMSPDFMIDAAYARKEFKEKLEKHCYSLKDLSLK